MYCAAGEAVVIGISGLMPTLGTEVGVCLCVFCGGGICESVCVYMDTDIDMDTYAFPSSMGL